jgi:hypothetical protein
MKIAAFLILLIGTLLLIGSLLAAIVILAFSADPLAQSDPATRVIQVAVIAVVVGCSALMWFGWRAYRLGDYPRVTPIAYVLVGFLGLSAAIYLGIRHFSRKNAALTLTTEAISPDDTEVAPIAPMHFYRGTGSSKTLLTVHPSGLVTYHVVTNGQSGEGVTVGQLNPSRDVLNVTWQGEDKLSNVAYDEFKNDQGESFVQMFNVR